MKRKPHKRHPKKKRTIRRRSRNLRKNPGKDTMIKKLAQLAGQAIEGYLEEKMPEGQTNAQYGFLYGLYRSAEIINGRKGAEELADRITQYMTYETFPIW